MVGESRDKETVSMGVEASLTGHLVFSTLHTELRARVDHPACWTWAWTRSTSPTPCWASWRSAWPSAVRLQGAYCPDQDEIKLRREYARTCAHRAWKADYGGEAQKLYEDWVEQYGEDGSLKFYPGGGCEKCNKTGYKGRVGLHELLIRRRRHQETDPGARPRGRALRGGRGHRACAP
jgi:hypothetical protein